MSCCEHIISSGPGGGGGGVSGIAAPGPLQFGADSVGTTTTTRYPFAGYSDQLAETSPHRMVITEDGTIQDMYVLHGLTAGNGNDIVYTLWVDDGGGPVDTGITVTLASTSSLGSDTVNTYAVTSGDLVYCEVTKAAGVVTSPTNVQISFEIVAA